LSALAPIGLGLNIQESGVILEPLNYDAYSVDEIYGYNPTDVEVEPEYKDIETNKIESFKQLIEPTGGPMDSAWPMYCHDIRHTGRSPYSTSGNVGFNKWWYKCNRYIEGSAAIDKEGVIYFGGAEDDAKGTTKYFYAMFPNGTLKWKCEVDDLIEAGPAIAEDGTIYVGECIPPSNLYSISPDGIINWKYQIGDNLQSSPAIGADGTIYIGDGGNWGIRAINPNGTLKWCYKTNMIVYSSPAIGSDGTVYCGSHDNYLYALYPDNGTLKWKYKTGHWIRTSPCIGDDGTIYCVSLDSYLYALYPNGTCKWKTKVGGGTSPTIGQDGTIYCGWDRLHAVNPVDGSIKWSFKPGSGRCIEGATPCTSADGTIYFGTRIDPTYGGEIIAVNSDGSEKWRQIIANDYVDFAPVIGEDGTVYIGSSTKEEVYSGAFRLFGYLHAFNKKDTQAPTTPVITGRKEPPSKTPITYGFLSISPLGNDVYYYIDWSDGDWKIDYWLGPYKSGKIAFINHSWSEPGDYTIRCRSKDSDNLWSDWSESDISVIKSRNHATHSSVWQGFLDMFPILERILDMLIVR
jgi:outer membrane protein assembly factor BamB